MGFRVPEKLRKLRLSVRQLVWRRLRTAERPDDLAHSSHQFEHERFAEKHLEYLATEEETLIFK